tara:strand:- start:292 stop:441 length:150 start_codon:yes stop_codon:yes gene_type:complete
MVIQSANSHNQVYQNPWIEISTPYGIKGLVEHIIKKREILNNSKIGGYG